MITMSTFKSCESIQTLSVGGEDRKVQVTALFINAWTLLNRPFTFFTAVNHLSGSIRNRSSLQMVQEVTFVGHDW